MLLVSAAVACGGEAASRGEPRPPAAPAAPDNRPVVLFLGTSLTAGLGVDPDRAYPAVLQRRFDSLNLGLRAVNAGVSGETSAGLLRRLPHTLAGDLRVVVVETGANDGLRGLNVDSTRANIEAIIDTIRGRDPSVAILLAGMEAPPNMGPVFTARFRDLFPQLAGRKNTRLVPFLLEGVGGVDTLNQDDGIHPNPAGHRVVADVVWRGLEPLVRRSP